MIENMKLAGLVGWTTPWWSRSFRYVFRIAMTNSRIVAFDEQTVSFRYKHRQGAAPAPAQQIFCVGFAPQKL
jgi:hypothetical protein